MPSVFFSKCRIFTSALYLSLWLVKTLRLPATLALLCSDKRCADSRPPYDVTNFEFDLCSFFVGRGNGSTPRKPPLHDQKAAENCFSYDCRSHPLPWDSNPRPQR